jgi:GATA-binding protein, other eukaryote
LSATGDVNGTDAQNLAQLAALSSLGVGRKGINGQPDDTHSPISRTDTPGMYNAHLPMYQNVDDGTQFAQGALGHFDASGRPSSPGAINGDGPTSHEHLMAANASLKTRVSELEVIQELYRSRLEQLEQDDQHARQAQELSGKTETQLRSQVESLTQSEAQLRRELEDSHGRENILKRRLDELEVELKEAKDAKSATEATAAPAPKEPLSNGRPAKRTRTTAQKLDEALETAAEAAS